MHACGGHLCALERCHRCQESLSAVISMLVCFLDQHLAEYKHLFASEMSELCLRMSHMEVSMRALLKVNLLMG